MSDNKTSPLLSTIDLGRKSLEGNWLFQSVNLQISAGESWAIRGKSGSGKTVLLRTLCLLDEPDAGSLHWNGESVEAHEVPQYRQQVLYLHQTPVLISGTVKENLELVEQFVPTNQSLVGFDIIRTWLKTCGKPESFLNSDSALISGGERQLVALMRALRLQPKLLLLDEATAALDQESRTSVERLVTEWLSAAPQTRATIWVSHDEDQINRMTTHSYDVVTGISSHNNDSLLNEANKS